MQLWAAQTSLEPQPHRVSRTGRGAVREPEHLRVTAADSRANPARSAPEYPRLPATIYTSCRIGAAKIRLWPYGRPATDSTVVGNSSVFCWLLRRRR